MIPKELAGKYVFEREIGCSVFLVHSRLSTTSLFAVKTVNRGFSTNKGVYDMQISILNVISSPFLLPFIEAIQGLGKMYLVMNCCPSGDLETFIKAQSGIDDAVCKQWLRDIGEGLGTLHEAGIAHTNLRLSTVMLRESDDSRTRAVVAGLDNIKLWDEVRIERRKADVFTAPETRAGQRCDMKADVWAFGVIASFLLTKPFVDMTSPQISPEASEFINAAQNPDPDARPSLKQLLSFPYFTDRPQDVIYESIVIDSSEPAQGSEYPNMPQQPLPGYSIESLLGQGSYGRVLKARHVSSGLVCAIKESYNFTQNRVKFEREIECMKKVDNKYVVGLYEVVQTEEKVFLVMEYCPGGDLQSYIDKTTRVEDRLAKRWLFQIANGCVAIGRSGIVHRDLKPGNILLSSTEATEAEAKIADFGESRCDVRKTMRQTPVGSPKYCSPEILNGTPASNKTDVWSFGVLMNELLGGSLFSGVKAIGQLIMYHQQIENMEIGNVSFAAAQLIKSCLKLDHHNRVSFEDIVRSPYFDDIRDSNPMSSIHFPCKYLLIAEHLTNYLSEYLNLARSLLDTDHAQTAIALCQIYIRGVQQCATDVQALLSSDPNVQALSMDCNEAACRGFELLEKAQKRVVEHPMHTQEILEGEDAKKNPGMLLDEAMMMVCAGEDLNGSNRIEKYEQAKILLRAGEEEEERQWRDFQRKKKIKRLWNYYISWIDMKINQKQS